MIKMIGIFYSSLNIEIAIMKDDFGMYYATLDGKAFFADWDYEKVRSVLC